MKKRGKNLNNRILDYLHDEFSDDNLDWSYDEDSDSEDGYTRNIINFWGEGYREGYTDDYTFIYIRKEYYDELEDRKFAQKWEDKAPLLDFTDIGLQIKFNMLFGTFWKPIFEKWFESVYPDFPVKTFIYKR